MVSNVFGNQYSVPSPRTGIISVNIFGMLEQMGKNPETAF